MSSEIGRGSGSLLLVPDDFLSALVKVHIEEDELFNAWHVIYSLEIKVNFMILICKVFICISSDVCH